MDLVLKDLSSLFASIWWPFCRIMAALTSAPILGDAMLPVRARALIALVLAITVSPGVHLAALIEPFSLQGISATVEQILIGSLLGFLFHLILSALIIVGTLVSSQMGLSMASLNDPLNGTSSDVISSLLYIVFILLFFSTDNHLVIVAVLGRSFSIWPVGSGFNILSLKTLVFHVGWLFSAALLLAVPVVFATFVVQLGLGFLNRAAPTLNLFSLGFSITTLFGLLLLIFLMPAIPDYYVRMVNRALDMLSQMAVVRS